MKDVSENIIAAYKLADKEERSGKIDTFEFFLRCEKFLKLAKEQKAEKAIKKLQKIVDDLHDLGIDEL